MISQVQFDILKERKIIRVHSACSFLKAKTVLGTFD